MLRKLSIRNVKRSFSGYAIYFLTLTFGVSLFYSFNSIKSQELLLDVSNIQKEILDNLTNLIGVVSVFVSFVLAFLILYANQFLVKRRKKELGLYQTLGMSKLNVSILLITETFVIGLFSLITGLGLGVFMSQGFSIIASSLLDVELLDYQFVFSLDATLKTIVYFSIIFMIVMIFNTIVISRFSLLDLLYDSKKNENIKIKNQMLSLWLFIIATLLIVSGYIGLINYGLSSGMIFIILFSSLIIIGTFIWFYSLGGFIVQLIKNKKNIYYKDLNIFVLRQISSKINTNFLSMVIISIMLVGTITILSTGFGYKHAMDEELKIVTPYDVTLFLYYWDEEIEEPNKIISFLEKSNITKSEIGNFVALQYYNPQLSANLLIEPYISKDEYQELFGDNTSNKVYAISQSDYIRLVELQEIKAIDMNDNEVIIFTNMKNMTNAINQFIDKAQNITINGINYEIANKEVELLSLQNTEVPRDKMMLVLPDNKINTLEKNAELLVSNYKDNEDVIDNKFNSMFEYYTKGEGNFPDTLPYTKTYIYESSLSYTASIIFIGFYLGIIFLVSSAAILTLQQLSEASDNISRYKILKRLGVNKEGINKVIFQQIIIYFTLPLFLATLHSIVVITIINRVALKTSDVSIIVPTIMTSLILLTIYGGYLLATYKGYKAIVK